MEREKCKYDILITRLLPTRNKLLAVKDRRELELYIHEFKESINFYDRVKTEQLSTLLKKLSGNKPNTQGKDLSHVHLECRNEALAILTNFFIELDPEE